MGDIHAVQKKGTNEFHNYKYVKAADVVADVRGVLLRHGVVVTVNLAGDITTHGNLMTFPLGFTFTNIDDPADEIYSTIPAAAQDKGDKAVWKAITGAIKYALTTNLMLPSYDDPEADSSVDRPEPKSFAPAKKAAPELISSLKTCIDLALKEGRVDGDKLNQYMVGNYGTDSLSELTEEQADQLMVMVKNKLEAK